MLACAIRAAQRCAGGSTAAGLASRTQQRWLSVAAVAENAGHPAGVVPGSPVDGAGRKRRKTLYTKLLSGTYEPTKEEFFATKVNGKWHKARRSARTRAKIKKTMILNGMGEKWQHEFENVPVRVLTRGVGLDGRVLCAATSVLGGWRCSSGARRHCGLWEGAWLWYRTALRLLRATQLFALPYRMRCCCRPSRWCVRQRATKSQRSRRRAWRPSRRTWRRCPTG
jgi:hypothetical protein